MNERILQLTQIMFFILIFVSFFGTSLPFTERSFDPYESETSNPINQIVYVLLFLNALYIYIRKFKTISCFIKNDSLLLIFILLCLVSFTWSQYPLISFKRSFQLLVTYLTILNTVVLISELKIIRGLLLTGLIYSLFNYIGCILIPDAIDPIFGTWRGIELSKNGLGYVSLMTLVIGFITNYSVTATIWKLLGKILIFLSSGLIIMAYSTTNIIAMVIIYLLLALNKASNTFVVIGIKRFVFYFFLGIIIIGSIVLSLYSKEIFSLIPGLFGKDSSLTGRDVIWLYIWNEIQKEFILGYGYGTYWIMGSHIIELFSSFVGWRVNEAHNGFLEVLLQLGIVGFFVFMSLLIRFIIKAIKQDNLPLILLIVGIVIVNFSESFVFMPRDISTLLFMLFYMFLVKKEFNNFLFR